MPLAQIFSQHIGLLRSGTAEGDFVTLVGSKDFNHITLFGELNSLLVRPFPEAPIRRADAARLAMIEGVAAALLLHIFHVEERIASQGLDALLQELGSLLPIGVFLRNNGV